MDKGNTVTVRALRGFTSTAHGSVVAGQTFATTRSRADAWIGAASPLVEEVTAASPRKRSTAPTERKPLGNAPATRNSRAAVRAPSGGTAKRSSASRPARASTPAKRNASAKRSGSAKRAR